MKVQFDRIILYSAHTVIDKWNAQRAACVCCGHCMLVIEGGFVHQAKSCLVLCTVYSVHAPCTFKHIKSRQIP